ncbi:DUF4199 domain-containing protein [Rufibacter roseus]|uniref:DUF4199 domain-containing protein n=1 Tax=Rufibacter roseus TaxID=1567108 RepID=A0ABW2DGJ8_9BACT|nr:DUF4199 domain-containing protein [Rufibacter roseus]
MDKKAVSTTAMRYGVTGGVVTFLYIICLALLGLESPYNNITEFSSTLIFVPIFVVLGIKEYKTFTNAAVGFGQAFMVGLAVTVFLGLTTAVLMCLFSLTIGSDMIQPYIVEMQRQMELNQSDPAQKIDEQKFKLVYQELEEMNALHLAQRTFMYRLITGLVVSIVSGVYFRK